jgi:hypothetical protein
MSQYLFTFFPVFRIPSNGAILSAIYHYQNPLELILTQAATNTEHNKERDYNRDKHLDTKLKCRNTFKIFVI